MAPPGIHLNLRWYLVSEGSKKQRKQNAAKSGPCVCGLFVISFRKRRTRKVRYAFIGGLLCDSERSSPNVLPLTTSPLNPSSSHTTFDQCSSVSMPIGKSWTWDQTHCCTCRCIRSPIPIMCRSESRFGFRLWKTSTWCQTWWNHTLVHTSRSRSFIVLLNGCFIFAKPSSVPTKLNPSVSRRRFAASVIAPLEPPYQLRYP